MRKLWIAFVVALMSSPFFSLVALAGEIQDRGLI